MTRARWTDSDPELRDLLAKARRIEDPPSAAKMRVAGFVQASMAGGAATAAHATKAAAAVAKGAGTAGAGAAKAGGVALLGGGGKGIVALVFAVAVSGGVAAVVHSSGSSPARERVVAAHVAPPAPVPAPGPVAAPATKADAPRAADPPSAVPPPAPRSAVLAPPPAPAVGRQVPGAPGAPGADDPPRRRELAEERALLDPARAALARGDAVSALAATRVHEQRFAEGALTEEREAIGIQALVLEGRLVEARARAVRFAETHPGSLVLPAIRASLPPDAIPDH